ncbi:MAG: outer membrane beta-barrel protein [Bacteroidetes bacterium]|nr:outer membrane beta-barrel protein [Bacteroidota bacterium]
MVAVRLVWIGFLFLFEIVISETAFSQASAGFKAGGGLFNINSSFKSEALPSWEAGFFSVADISEHVILQPEIDYSDKGGKVTFEDTVCNVHLQSANVRILVSYLFNDRFSLGAGPYFSYMFKASQSKVIVPKSWYSPFGVGFNAAASVNAGLWIFSVRYDQSLTLLTRDGDVEISKSINPLKSSHVSGFSLVVCVGFD